jgi:hypothetical protein
MAYIPVINNTRLGTDAVTTDKVLNGTLTHDDVDTDNIDGAAATPSLRTLGFGAGQALEGNITLNQIADPVADIVMGGNKITNLGTPTAGTDAANKDYVDAVASGLDPKNAVLYTTTGDITLSGLATQTEGTWPGALTAGDRILVWQQTDPIENGIYDAQAGAWVRSDDFDGSPSNEVTNGAYTLVSAADGTEYVGTGFVVTSADPLVVDTDPIEWTPFSAAGSVSVFDDLTDVDLAGAVTNSTVRFDGTDWVDTQNVLIDDDNSTITLGAQAIADAGGNLELSASGNIALIDKVDMQAAQRVNIQVVAGDHAVDLDADYIVVLDTTAAVRTATLPATHAAGDQVVVKRSGANNAVVETDDADTIDGVGTDFVLDVNLMAVTFVSDGTGWWVF